jgi:hypothetical protein
MVMGAVGGVGGVGVPGPPGPPGVQGPPGPIGTIDGNSPLSVQVKATTMLGLPIPTNTWVVLDFPQREVDTHQGVTPGPLWRWVTPMRGVYHLLATVRLEPVLPAPTWQLRVLKSGQVIAEAAFSGYSGQIAWLGALINQEDLQVQIWSSSAAILSAQQPVLPATVSIAGVGVAL